MRNTFKIRMRVSSLGRTLRHRRPRWHGVGACALFFRPSPVPSPSAPPPAVPFKRFYSGLPWVLFLHWNISEHYSEQKGTGQLIFMAACHQPQSPLFLGRMLLPLSGFHFPFAASSIINFFLSFHYDLECKYSVFNSTSDYVNISWNLLNYIFPNKEQHFLPFLEGTAFFILKSCHDLRLETSLYFNFFSF